MARSRGGPPPQRTEGPHPPSGPARDTWMTDLPEERRAAAAPSQVNVVSPAECPCAGHIPRTTHGWRLCLAAWLMP